MFKVLQGDAASVLDGLPPQSVHAICTSPPYYRLRAYDKQDPHKDELGWESHPDEYVKKLVGIFALAWHVLRDDGTLWVVIADSYVESGKGGNRKTHRADGNMGERSRKVGGLKKKERCAVPERFVLAMQEWGWHYIDEIIWHKPNPFPYSGGQRTTPSHEKIFLFSKKPHYFIDMYAIREEMKESSIKRLTQNVQDQAGSLRAHDGAHNGPMKAAGHVHVLGEETEEEALTLFDLPEAAPIANGHTKPPRFGGGKGSGVGRNPYSGKEWGDRPQANQAIARALEAGLTEEHIAAIRATGLSDVGKTRETQNINENADTNLLYQEAREALGGYTREFISESTRRAFSFARQTKSYDNGKVQQHREDREPTAYFCGANRRSVWTVPTPNYKGDHFATYPIALVERMLLAATSERGVCQKCGAPFRRIVSKGAPDLDWQQASGGDAEGRYNGQAVKEYDGTGAQDASDLKRRILAGMTQNETMGWYPTCKCHGMPVIGFRGEPKPKDLKRAAEIETAPAVVLDPFSGHATTGVAALGVGRDYVGIELYEKNVEASVDRLCKVQPEMLSRRL